MRNNKKKNLSKYEVAYNANSSFPDLFEIVKLLVEEKLGSHRGGLMLGLTDLGMGPNGFIGAFFMIGSNAIVINRQPLNLVRNRTPELHKAYMFYLLLHEYLHSIGLFDEVETRSTAFELAKEAFGKYHPVSRIAENFSGIFGDIIHPSFDYMPPEDITIELIPEFDKSSVTYIQ